MIVIQCCIEQQEEASLSLMSPHRIVREHHYVTLTNRHINYCRCVCQLRSARKHPADQETLFI